MNQSPKNGSVCAIEEMRQAVGRQVERERANFSESPGTTPELEGDQDLRDIVTTALGKNEDGDAELFRMLQENQFLYDHGTGQWFFWKGHFWAEDELHQALRALEPVIDLYADEAERLTQWSIAALRRGEDDRAKDLAKEAKAVTARMRQLQTLKRKQDVLSLSAAGESPIAITGEEWDADPMLLGCLNGVIDLHDGTFRPGQPVDYIKTISPLAWDGILKTASTWEKFLSVVFDENWDLINYLQRLLGYAITGLTTEHILPVLWGKGRNGKSTLLETIQHVLGDLSGPIPAEMLLDQDRFRSSAGPSPDIMSLRGKRLVWGNETNEGRKFDQAKVKWLAGGDTLMGRNPYGKRIISFRPTHTLFLSTNHKPKVPGNDYAFWKRIHLIPFEFQFVDDPKEENERPNDPLLLEKLKQEGAGILSWLVQGTLKWQKVGLKPPSTVLSATEEYRQEEDLLGIFLEDTCNFADGLTVQASKLYAAYRQWCEDMGHHPMSGTAFGKEMSKRFNKQKEGVMSYFGVSLKLAWR
jgi:putative DNA primase/helicase